MGNGGSAANAKAIITVDGARKRFSPLELRVFEHGFDRLCKASPRGGYTSIDYNTFKHLVLADFPDIPDALTKRMFAVMDTNGSQSLDFSELLCGLGVLARGKLEERLKFLFAIYDTTNMGVLNRNILEHFAGLLDDDRLSQDERFSSKALIEEAFRYTPGRPSLYGNEINMAEFAQIVTKFMSAPLISWPINLGQRLLDPLFQLPQPSPRATQAVKRSSSRLRFDEDSLLRTSSVGSMSPTSVGSKASPGTPSARSSASNKNNNKRVLRYQSSRSQLNEGARFKEVYFAPSQDKFVPGEHWYILSTSWFDTWKRYTGFTESVEDEQETLTRLETCDRPGPIDNRELVRDWNLRKQSLAEIENDQASSNQFHAIRTDIHYRHEFLLLNQAAWDLLYTTYGGGPILKREVITSEGGIPELELYPITLNVRCVAFSSDDENDIGFLLQQEPQVETLTSNNLSSSPLYDDDDLEDSHRVHYRGARSTSSRKGKSKQIVVSKRSDVKDLENLILRACLGEQMQLKSRHRAHSNTSNASSKFSYESSNEDHLPSSPPSSRNIVSMERMRLWCVLGADSSSSALENALQLGSSPTTMNGRGRSPPPRTNMSVQLLSDPFETVEDANLEDGQTIVLELCSADGCWPFATLSSLKPKDVSSPRNANGDNPASSSNDHKRVLMLGGGRLYVPSPSSSSTRRSQKRKQLGHHQRHGSNMSAPVRPLSPKLSDSDEEDDEEDDEFSTSSSSGRDTPSPPPPPTKTNAPFDALKKSNSSASLTITNRSASVSASASLPSDSPRNHRQLDRMRPTNIPATIGLCNLGNTCFMSSALQCLIHTDLFKDYFLNGSYVIDINTESKMGTKGHLADACADLIRTAWTGEGGNGRIPLWIAPRRFKKEMGKFDSKFVGFEQQDAQELLSSLLDGLSEDLNRIKSKPYIELKDSNGRADAEVAREWWESHLRRELSIITALFTGQFKSLLECSECGYQSARFEPYMTLSLPLPDSPYRTVMINVVFADASRPPLSCSVRVKKDGKFGDVKAALLELQPGETGEVTNSMNNPEERERVHLESSSLVLALVFERQIFSIIGDPRPIHTLKDRELVFAFQLPRISDHDDEFDSSEERHVGDQHELHDDDDNNDNTDDADVDEKQKHQGAINDEDFSPAPQEIDRNGEKTPPAALREGMRVKYLPPEADDDQEPVIGVVTGVKPNDMVEIRIPVESQQRSQKSSRKISVKRDAVELFKMSPVLIKIEQRQWHKHTCYFLNPYRVTSVGMPFIIYGQPDRITGLGLYKTIAAQLGVDAIASDEEEDNNKNCSSSLDTDEKIRNVWGFKLVSVTRAGGTCRCCPWMKSCNGCPILPDRKYLAYHGIEAGSTVAVDWGIAASIKDQHMALSMEVADKHSSVEGCRREEYKEMPLSSLIENFTKPEVLEDVRCSRCKDFKDHKKKIELWRAPPVLVIHLKRFQHSSYRRKKLLNLVNFPLEDLNLNPYLAKSMPEDLNLQKKEPDNGEENESNDSSNQSKPEETASSLEEQEYQERQQEIVNELLNSRYVGVRNYGGHEHGDISAQYDLFGVVDHSGSLGAGHYVASARNSVDDRWYRFDDKVVTQIDDSKALTSNAYLLFYVRKDVQKMPVTDVYPCEVVDPKQVKAKMKEIHPYTSPITSASEKCVIS